MPAWWRTASAWAMCFAGLAAWIYAVDALSRRPATSATTWLYDLRWSAIALAVCGAALAAYQRRGRRWPSRALGVILVVADVAATGRHETARAAAVLAAGVLPIAIVAAFAAYRWGSPARLDDPELLRGWYLRTPMFVLALTAPALALHAMSPVGPTPPHALVVLGMAIPPLLVAAWWLAVTTRSQPAKKRRRRRARPYQVLIRVAAVAVAAAGAVGMVTPWAALASLSAALLLVTTAVRLGPHRIRKEVETTWSPPRRLVAGIAVVVGVDLLALGVVWLTSLPARAVLEHLTGAPVGNGLLVVPGATLVGVAIAHLDRGASEYRHWKNVAARPAVPSGPAPAEAIGRFRSVPERDRSRLSRDSADNELIPTRDAAAYAEWFRAPRFGDEIPGEMRGLVLRGGKGGTGLPSGNPWQLPTTPDLDQVVRRLWTPAVPYLPGFLERLLAAVFAVAMVRHADEDRLAYLGAVWVSGEVCDVAAATIEELMDARMLTVVELWGRPPLPAADGRTVPVLGGPMPEPLRALAAVHRSLTGVRRDRHIGLENLRGVAGGAHVAFARRGDTSYLLDPDVRDAAGEPTVVRHDPDDGLVRTKPEPLRRFLARHLREMLDVG